MSDVAHGVSHVAHGVCDVAYAVCDVAHAVCDVAHADVESAEQLSGEDPGGREPPLLMFLIMEHIFILKCGIFQKLQCQLSTLAMPARAHVEHDRKYS